MERTVPRPRAALSLGRLSRAAAACLALWCCGTAATGARRADEVAPPRLNVVVSTLANGLRLILHEDRSTPVVHVQVWYHVGSKNEPPGRTGVAHLLERLMFMGSRNVQPGQHASLIADVGGQASAYSTEDVTVLWETVPSEYLPLVLWLEADRMATLRLDRSAFDRERDLAKEERRMRAESQPYGRLAEIVNGFAFTAHPYRNPALGVMADLDAASADDVREFYRAYVVPANATVVIAGDFDPAVATDLVTKYFGRIPRRDSPAPSAIPPEPAQTSPRRLAFEERWPQPVVVVAHHATFDGHPDSYPLHVASKILSDGRGSRLYQNLVYQSGVATSAASSSRLGEHPGLFYAYAVVQPGHTADEAERALAKELDRLRTEPVSDRELARARRQFTRDSVLGRQTLQQKAGILGRAAVLHAGDMALADAELERFQRVTAADIQRVAQQYFAPATRMVITVSPALVKEERK